MCGRSIAEDEIVEKIDGSLYSFDRKTCLMTLKKLGSVYGDEFLADFVRQNSS